MRTNAFRAIPGTPALGGPYVNDAANHARTSA